MVGVSVEVKPPLLALSCGLRGTRHRKRVRRGAQPSSLSHSLSTAPSSRPHRAQDPGSTRLDGEAENRRSRVCSAVPVALTPSFLRAVSGQLLSRGSQKMRPVL